MDTSLEVGLYTISARQLDRILCVMLKLWETLTIAINVENNGVNVRSVLEREAQETPKTKAVEETAQSP